MLASSQKRQSHFVDIRLLEENRQLVTTEKLIELN